MNLNSDIYNFCYVQLGLPHRSTHRKGSGKNLAPLRNNVSWHINCTQWDANSL